MHLSGDTDGYAATVSIFLEAAAFDLDARLNAGAALAEFSTEQPAQAYALALGGERPASFRGGRRELVALIKEGWATDPAKRPEFLSIEPRLAALKRRDGE